MKAPPHRYLLADGSGYTKVTSCFRRVIAESQSKLPLWLACIDGNGGKRTLTAEPLVLTAGPVPCTKSRKQIFTRQA